MNPSHALYAFYARLATWIERMVCRIHCARRRQRHRAELAMLSAHDLRDIGVTHRAAIPTRQACCA